MTVEDYTHVTYHWRETFPDSTIVFRKWLEYLEAKYARFLKDDTAAVRLVFGFDN